MNPRVETTINATSMLRRPLRCWSRRGRKSRIRLARTVLLPIGRPVRGEGCEIVSQKFHVGCSKNDGESSDGSGASGG
jgi:hypothetical protein